MELEELRKDLAELKEISIPASRKRVVDILSVAQHKLATEILMLEQKLTAATGASSSGNQPSGSSKTTGENKTYVVDLNEYAWDQSDKFVKIFVTVDGVGKLTEDDVQTDFTDNSMNLAVKNLNNRHYRLVINNLLSSIDVEKSYRKIKTDMVAIYMKKAKEGENWSHLTRTEKRLNDIKDSKLKTEAAASKDDPTSGIMDLMKKMYETGDPETKRMIAKAWTEGQEKQANNPRPI